MAVRRRNQTLHRDGPCYPLASDPCNVMAAEPWSAARLDTLRRVMPHVRSPASVRMICKMSATSSVSATW
eukprot:2738899-Rhodomonas_salina.1